MDVKFQSYKMQNFHLQNDSLNLNLKKSILMWNHSLVINMDEKV